MKTDTPKVSKTKSYTPFSYVPFQVKSLVPIKTLLEFFSQKIEPFCRSLLQCKCTNLQLFESWCCIQSTLTGKTEIPAKWPISSSLSVCLHCPKSMPRGVWPYTAAFLSLWRQSVLHMYCGSIHISRTLFVDAPDSFCGGAFARTLICSNAHPCASLLLDHIIVAHIARCSGSCNDYSVVFYGTL